MPKVSVLCSCVLFLDLPQEQILMLFTLCTNSPSNLIRRTRAYHSLTNVRVAPLYLSEQDLTVDRMLALMGCDNLEVSIPSHLRRRLPMLIFDQDMPLYMNTVLRIMRSMGVDRFTYNGTFPSWSLATTSLTVTSRAKSSNGSLRRKGLMASRRQCSNYDWTFSTRSFDRGRQTFSRTLQSVKLF